MIDLKDIGPITNMKIMENFEEYIRDKSKD